MDRIVLVELWILLDLAHQDEDGRGAAEDTAFGGALIRLPSIDEMVDALLEELGVDLDVGHVGAGAREGARGVSRRIKRPDLGLLIAEARPTKGRQRADTNERVKCGWMGDDGVATKKGAWEGAYGGGDEKCEAVSQPGYAGGRASASAHGA